MVALTTLPVEARETVALIDRDGPFPYAKDGAVFGNRERLLPAGRTASTGSTRCRRRGGRPRTRRIVTGDDGGQLFYTADHYASFVRVRR